MRYSTHFGRTLREAPAGVDRSGRRLLLRAGVMRLIGGVRVLLPVGAAAAARIVAQVRAALAAAAAQPVALPHAGADPQHFGEQIAALAAREISSYRQLPALLYQEEPAALLAASLRDADADADRFTPLLAPALAACNLTWRIVDADAGGGGRRARYMTLAAAGEEEVLLCNECSYGAMIEAAARPAPAPVSAEAPPAVPVLTPDCPTIAALAVFLGIPTAATAKAVFFDTPERGLLFAVVRGDLEVNAAKLCAVAGVSALAPASSDQIAAAGAVPGYASPVGLAVRAPDDLSNAGVFVVADASVTGGIALAAGANREGYHLRDAVYGRDWQATIVADIAQARAGDPCPRCGAALEPARGDAIAEAVYALAGARYRDQSGVERPVRIDVVRLDSAGLIEALADAQEDAAGIAWPAGIAPFDLHVLRLGKSEAVIGAADAIYRELAAAGLEVLYDDRDDSAGVKFNDADLLGLPVRLVVGEKLLAEDAVEIRPRGGAAEKIPRAELVARLRALLAEQK
jgi:prolyl-tRNA synthetase